MSLRRPRIGVFGGTFNPVHIGHLRMAIESREALGFDRVHMVVSALPPHRAQPGVSAEMRLRMLELATAGCEGLVADDREIRRSGPSWMLDTLAELRADYGQEAAICLVIGMDAFVTLESWWRWQELVDYAHIAVLMRPGEWSAPAALARWASDRWRDDPDTSMCDDAHGNLFGIELSQIDLSSTAVRERLMQERSARFLVPDPVLEFIADNGLYAGTGD